MKNKNLTKLLLILKLILLIILFFICIVVYIIYDYYYIIHTEININGEFINSNYVSKDLLTKLETEYYVSIQDLNNNMNLYTKLIDHVKKNNIYSISLDNGDIEYNECNTEIEELLRKRQFNIIVCKKNCGKNIIEEKYISIINYIFKVNNLCKLENGEKLLDIFKKLRIRSITRYRGRTNEIIGIVKDKLKKYSTKALPIRGSFAPNKYIYLITGSLKTYYKEIYFMDNIPTNLRRIDCDKNIIINSKWLIDRHSDVLKCIIN